MLYFFDKSIQPPFQSPAPQPTPLPPSLFPLLVLAPFSSPSVWENWSARMEWYQPADRVICPTPSFLRSFHHTFDTKIKYVASLFRFTVALVLRKEYGARGSHGAVGRQEGPRSRLVAITHCSQAPYKIPWTFRLRAFIRVTQSDSKEWH